MPSHCLSKPTTHYSHDIIASSPTPTRTHFHETRISQTAQFIHQLTVREFSVYFLLSFTRPFINRTLPSSIPLHSLSYTAQRYSLIHPIFRPVVPRSSPGRSFTRVNDPSHGNSRTDRRCNMPQHNDDQKDRRKRFFAHHVTKNSTHIVQVMSHLTGINSISTTKENKNKINIRLTYIYTSSTMTDII